MKTLATIIREVFGLFVDDGRMALALFALLAGTAYAAYAALLDPRFIALLLVAGAIAVLVENVVRSAG